jgi:hypothetical protein
MDRGMSRLQQILLTSLLAMFLCHPALAKTTDQEMLAQGKQHLQNQKYSFATTWFERLLKTYPASSYKKEVLLLMSQAYLATDREEKAADALRTLVKQYPEEAVKLSARQLELAKRPPRSEKIEQQPVPSSVISGGLMANKPIPIPIIDPPLENPGGPEGQQILSDGTNIYATSTLADNAVDIAETRGTEAAQRGVETMTKNEPTAAPVIERPAAKAPPAAAVPAVAAAPAAPVKVGPATTGSAPSSSKPAAADKKAAVAPPPVAPSTTPPAKTPSATKPSAAVSPAAVSPAAVSPAAVSPAAVSPAAVPSAAVPSAAVPSAAVPSAAVPSATAPAAAASVAPQVAVQSAKTTTDTAKVLPRLVAPAKQAAPKPAAKAATVTARGIFTLKIGEYLLPPEVADVKKKLVKAGLSPQVVEGRKKMPVVRLEVEGVTDLESARKKLEDVRKASGTGIIMVSKDGKRRLYAGSYLNGKVAEQEQQRLAALGIRSSLQKAVAPIATYSVSAGPFDTREAALEQERKLAMEGLQAVLVQVGK